MVTHHPKTTGRNQDIEWIKGSHVTGVQVRLVQRDPVDLEPTSLIAATDAIPRKPDHPLDEIVLVRCSPDHSEDVIPETGVARRDGLEARGAVEHHDLAALRTAEPVGHLVHQHPVADVQRVLH